jgi:two-component system, sensor histidine kinase and response regulator
MTLGNYSINKLSRSKRKILVIADNNDLLDEITSILKYENYDVAQAKSGDDKLALMKTEIPDLIICDIVMKDIDEFDVLRRKNLPEPLIPFIFIININEKNKIRKCIVAGKDTYLIKPFTRIELLRTIKTQITKHTKKQNQIKQFNNKFLNSLLNEIKTPLRTIIGSGRIMTNLPEIMSEKDIKDTGTYVCKQSLILEELINKFVILIEIETYKNSITTNKSTISARKIAQCAGKIAEKYNRKHDLIVKASEITLFASKKWFLIAMNELINNAFKASDYGENVIIRVEKKNDFVEVLIHIINAEKKYYTEEMKRDFIKIEKDSTTLKENCLSMMLVLQIVSLYNGELYVLPSGNKTESTLIVLPLSL